MGTATNAQAQPRVTSGLSSWTYNLLEAFSRKDLPGMHIQYLARHTKGFLTPNKVTEMNCKMI